MHSAQFLEDVADHARQLAETSRDVTSRNRLTLTEHRHITKDVGAVLGALAEDLRFYENLLRTDLQGEAPGKFAERAYAALCRATTVTMVARQRMRRVTACTGGLYVGTPYVTANHPMVRAARATFTRVEDMRVHDQLKPGTPAELHVAAVQVMREIIRALKIATGHTDDAVSVMHEHVTAEIRRPVGTQPTPALERAWAETHEALTACIGFLATAESALIRLAQAIPAPSTF